MNGPGVNGFGLVVLDPRWLLGLAALPALWYVWRRWPPPLARRRSLASLLARMLLVTLLVLALAGTRLTVQPHQRAVVAVVDLSASLRHDVESQVAAVRELQAGRGADDLFGVVSFAHGAAVELPPTRDPNFAGFESQPDPSYTDIAGALRLGAGLIPDGYARQLVLLTDGRENLGDAAATIAALRAEGVRVDVVAAGGPPGPEALVLDTQAPSRVHEGETVPVTVRLSSTAAAAGTLTLQVDGAAVESRPISLAAGVSNQSFQLPSLASGLHRVRVELNVSPDTYPDNNVGEAAIKVLGRPSILVLEGAPGGADNLVAALRAGGMLVERRPAAQAPTDTATLGRYDTVVVADAAADAFPAGALDAIEATVRGLGHGLVAVGGPNAYGPGGWQGTGLERALPVRMDLPPRKEKPHVAVAFVLESMENPQYDQLVINAVDAVIEKLTPEDTVSVTINNGSGFLIGPNAPVSDPKAMEAQLASAANRFGDGTYRQHVLEAGAALEKAQAPLKHMVILGDGDDATGGDYQGPLQTFKAEGITTSAIGVNTHNSATFMAAMSDLARWGGGRFYETDSAVNVPDLFLRESQTALRPWFEEQPFFPKVTAGGDLLAGVPLDAFPQLGGYVVTTAKPGSEVYFNSPKQDPVLAGWQYGLGRAVAWTPDTAGRWTAGFLRSAAAQPLLARMVAWTLPVGDDDSLQATAAVQGDQLQVTVNGPPASGSTLKVTVVRPDLTVDSASLTATAPGRWQGHLPASAVGTYLLRFQLARGGAPVGSTELQFVMPFSPEYLYLGRDDPTLREFAHLGGTLLARPRTAWRQPALPVPTSTPIFWVLLLIVAVLWPLDVALRRLVMTWAQAAEVAGALVRGRRPESLTMEAPPELARLTRRVGAYRRPAAGAAPPAGAAAPGASAPTPGEPARQTGGEEGSPVAAGALSARLLEARRKRRGSSD